VTNISQSFFTYKTAAKINWHRYGAILRHCHRMTCIRCERTITRHTGAYPSCRRDVTGRLCCSPSTLGPRPSAATRRASDILEMRLPFNSVNVHTKLFKRLLNVYTDIAASKETHTAFVRITALWYSTSCYSTGSQRPHR